MGTEVPVKGLVLDLPPCVDDEAREGIAALWAAVGTLPNSYDDTQVRAAIAALAAREDADDREDAEGKAALEQLSSQVAAWTQYDDAALKAEIAAVKARLAAQEGKPDDDEDEEARAQIVEDRARLAALEANPTGSGGGTGALGSVKTPFITFGADDTQRFVNLVAKVKSGWRGEVEFEVRNHNCPVQIPTLTTMRWWGTAGRAGEWGTGTTITYTGPAGTSMFVLYKNTGYSYPANGVSRDALFTGIQFNAGNDRDFLPPAPGGFDANYVQWYWRFHDCSWVGWRRIVNGWLNGVDFSGFTHVQGVATTPLKFGGSENKLGLGGGFMDSDNATWKAGGLPFLEWSASKSVLGSIMISARDDSYQMKVTYGHNSRSCLTEFDAPDGNPTKGYQVRFIAADATGANNFHFIGDSFKGGQGILCQTGKTEVAVDSCAFHLNRGLARCESSFNGVLLWGLTNTYGDCPRVIYVARGNQLILGDPRVTVLSLDGTRQGIRNPDGTITTAYQRNATTGALLRDSGGVLLAPVAF